MRMKLRWRAAACAGLLGLLVCLLTQAGTVRDICAQALALCARSVVPALFPFLVISSLLLSLGFGQLAAPWLAGLMEPLFRVPGCGSAAVLLGLIGGYPIGAGTAAELYRSGMLSRQESERLLTFANTSNPVFLISVVGAGVFGSVRTGVWLWLIHLLSTLLTGLLFRGQGREPRQIPSAPPSRAPVSFVSAFVAAVGGSASALLSVCAFVSFFYVLARPLASVGGRWGPVLTGMTELFSLVPLLTADRFGFLLVSAAAGWGGLSVLCQTAAVLEGSGLSPRRCLLGHAVRALLAFLLAALLSGYVLG